MQPPPHCSPRHSAELASRKIFRAGNKKQKKGKIHLTRPPIHVYKNELPEKLKEKFKKMYNKAQKGTKIWKSF